jgi:hypothetical protein
MERGQTGEFMRVKMDKQKRALGLLSAAVCVMISLGLTVTAVSAQGANLGFETGDFSGWTVSIPDDGSAQVVTNHTSGLGTEYLPVEGTYFAFLEPDGPGIYTMLNQSFELAAGETLCGHAAFDTEEDPEEWYNDNASVRILDSSLNEMATPWYSDVSMIGPTGDAPWSYWEWTAPASGTYILQLRVTNAHDAMRDSYALFDGCVGDCITGYKVNESDTIMPQATPTPRTVPTLSAPPEEQEHESNPLILGFGALAALGGLFMVFFLTVRRRC